MTLFSEGLSSFLYNLILDLSLPKSAVGDLKLAKILVGSFCPPTKSAIVPANAGRRRKCQHWTQEEAVAKAEAVKKIFDPIGNN